MNYKYSDTGLNEKYSLNFFNIFTLIIFISVPVLYFALDYKILPVILVSGFFIFVFSSILVFELTEKIELIFAFLILVLSFHGFSSFPGSNFTEVNNYIIISFIYILLLITFIFSRPKRYLTLKLSRTDKKILSVFLFFFFISILINFKDLTEIPGFGKITILILSGFLMCGYVPGQILENKKTLTIFLKSLIYFGIVTGIFGVITMIYPYINSFNLYPGTTISYFKHPNATASIYNFTVPASLYFLFFRKNEISAFEKYVYLIGILLMFFNVLFTLSRTGIISMGIIFLIMSFVYSKKLFYASLLSIPILLVYAFSGFLTSKGASTAIGRIGLLATTIEMFNSSDMGKLWGHGSYSTIKIFEKIKISLNVTDENNVPHNVLVYFILQFGIIPAIPLFIFLFKAFYKSVIRLSKSKNKGILSLSVAICISLLFKNMGEDLLFFPEFIIYHLFLIFFGFILILLNNDSLMNNSE